jgi:nucleoid-associated protein YgaU
VKTSPEVEAAPVRTTRVAKPGDTLTKLVAEVYGSCNKRLFDAVRQRNPHVANPDIVLVGQTIVFPEMDAPRPAETKPTN